LFSAPDFPDQLSPGCNTTLPFKTPIGKRIQPAMYIIGMKNGESLFYSLKKITMDEIPGKKLR
jgi:hypothetical protein